jgi:glycosyltransferase involved in cell wall biosynthesis
VTCIGYVPAAELALWYNSAEVFVFPSVYEGFGLPVLEAMACGTPVIVSNVSSLPEVAGTSGLMLPPHDVEAWTDALALAYQDVNWRSAASQNGQQEASRYRWQTTARQTLRSYQCALMSKTQ